MATTLVNSYTRMSGKEEICNVIKWASKKGGSILWQNIGDEKIACEIERLEINLEINTLFLYLKDKGKFDHDKPFYVKLSHRETIFKAVYLADFEEVLSVEIPDELLTKENRQDFRYKFKSTDRMTVTLSYEINLIKSSWQNIEYSLLDIGLGGMSLICHEKMASLLATVKTYYIDAINSKKLETPIEVSFLYSQKGKYKMSGKIVEQNRVGFKFNTKLTKSELKNLLTSV